MKKNIAKILLLMGICTTLFGNLPVYAASKYYDATVPVLADFETSLITASTDSYAVNQVDYIEKGKLTSWVENTSSKNCSNKVTYDAAGSQHMNYDTQKTDTVKLNISTATTSWSKIATSGFFYS